MRRDSSDSLSEIVFDCGVDGYTRSDDDTSRDVRRHGDDAVVVKG